MPRILYLGEQHKIEYYNEFKPVILDLSRGALETLVLLILNGTDLDYALEFVTGFKNRH
jgi:hypothetical protein